MCVCVYVCVCVCVPRSIVTFNANLQAVDVKVTAHKTITLCSVYLPFRNHFNFNCNPKDLQHVTDQPTSISFYSNGRFQWSSFFMGRRVNK